MMTVKEISDISGISIRTLHYYDEIGLLKPTVRNEAGYRFYDDEALETLQQILLFREFDIPLKEIKAIIETPGFDKARILATQRKMLETKKHRIEHMLASIDEILKGENKMDFKIFNKTEIEEMFEAMLKNMPDDLKQTAITEFGSLEKWKKHYIEVVSSVKMQRSYKKMIEWYGDKEKALDSVKNPPSKEMAAAFLRREENILNRLYAKKNMPVNSFEIKELIGEYGFITKKLYSLNDESGFMLALAKNYRNEKVRKNCNQKYGTGAAEFFAKAIEGFYIK